MPNQIAGRPPAEIWGPYLKKALAYREANNNSLRGFPMLTYNNDRWYADPKGNNRYSSKSITVKKMKMVSAKTTIFHFKNTKTLLKLTALQSKKLYSISNKINVSLS